ncbi:MAG: ATP-binding protein [Phycisphaerae bacterium]|nr:ATP-binding protein [Phycisphaerae bacterium]
MASVLHGRYDSIRLEPPGPEGQGIEFWLRSGDGREYHQVKRQVAWRGYWTLRKLHEVGVLAAFRGHLADDRSVCFFVSSQDAHDLRELADRARSAADFPEFDREFAKGESGSRFSEVLTYWTECERLEAFSLLRRIHVRTIDEETLRRLAELELTLLVEGDTGAASDVLFAYTLDSVHQELDSTRISDHLRRQGFNRPVWADPQTLSDVVKKANERYTARLQRELIRGELIPRDEAARVSEALGEGSAKRGAVVTGGAGSGKSTVLLEVIESLRQQGVAALAIRVDQLEPTQQPDEAGRQIGLPSSPVTTLAAMARGERCVLILDQLDAVSLASGRNPEFFECFDEMVRQALTAPGMRVVIACRRFDFDNDDRLRRLGSCDDAFEHVEVGTLSDDAVRRTAEALGIEPSRLADKQVKLLAVPNHLRLLCEVAQGAGTSLTFQTANELYGLYWQRKDQLLRTRLGPTVTWSPVVDRLCAYMSERQALSAPKTTLDDVAAIRDALLSEHVLVQDGARVSFFHEGFFDYAFARRFAATGSDLLALLRVGEQHLFRRAQVRQILLHEREIDWPRYVDNLRALLQSADIRFHIKQVVFALLRQFTAPKEEEWRILEALQQDGGYPDQDEVWSAIRTLSWFRLLDSLGVVEGWLLQSDSDTIDRAVVLLNAVARDAAERVAALVEPYVGTSQDWRNRHRYLVQWADLHAGRRFFDLFLRLLDSGDLDGLGRSGQGDFFSLLYELTPRRPDWACEAIGRFLTRKLQESLKAGNSNPFSDTNKLQCSQASDRVLIGSAQGAPGAFAMHVLPVVLRVLDLNADRKGEKPWEDSVWRWRHAEQGHTVADHLLYATVEALQQLARAAPDEFSRVAALLRDSEYETAQSLLMRGYAAGAERFADEAVSYLCESPRRLRCGYFRAGSSHGASRYLINSATPICSDEHLANLETMLLAYYTDWESSAGGARCRGETQFELLLAIDEKRRSPRVRARIGEWQRKFGTEAPSEPARRGLYMVSSPIPATAAEKMTDKQWLSAVSRYSGEKEEWRDGRLVGGPRELSQTLEARAREEPQRFARLVVQFPEETNAAYFDAVLCALDGRAAGEEELFEACRRCHRLPKRPAGSAFCLLVQKLPGLPWPEDLLDAIAWYATEDSSPDRELWRIEASNGQCYYRGDICMAGMNCVRGAAARAVSALLREDARRLSRFLPSLRRMVRDRSIAVRSCVVTSLLPILNHDRDLAVELFLQLCDTEEVLLKTHYVEEFMHYATATHFSHLRPVIERMLRSGDAEVAQTGARRACVASLELDDTAELLEQCLTGSVPLRAGASEVFAANFGQARFRGVCEARLQTLFDDPSEKVRELAAACFGHLEGDALGGCAALVERFQSSAAFAMNHGHLIGALESTTSHLPDATVAVCDRFIEIAGARAGDIQTHDAAHAYRLNKLIIRAYHQAGSEDINRRCLDVIDNLLRVRALGLQEDLCEFDR